MALSGIQIYNTFSNRDVKIHFDDFDFSWEPPIENDYYERILLNDMTKLIYHLNSSNINYFIRDRAYPIVTQHTHTSNVMPQDVNTF